MTTSHISRGDRIRHGPRGLSSTHQRLRWIAERVTGGNCWHAPFLQLSFGLHRSIKAILGAALCQLASYGGAIGARFVRLFCLVSGAPASLRVLDARSRLRIRSTGTGVVGPAGFEPATTPL